MIPWASPLAQYRAHRGAIQTAITRVLEGGTYVLGEEVESFERTFADYCGVANGVGVGSGTDALILALRALGIGPGDEVITVSHTAVATVAAVLASGATPVLVDVDPIHYTIDPSRIEAAITPRSKAIVVVHIYGQPAEMDSIVAIGRGNICVSWRIARRPRARAIVAAVSAISAMLPVSAFIRPRIWEPLATAGWSSQAIRNWRRVSAAFANTAGTTRATRVRSG